jgi:hypothetical protein
MVSDIGVQCEDFVQATSGNNVSVQCGTSIWDHRDVGTSCRKPKNTQAKWSQTDELPKCSRGVGYTVKTTDMQVQTLSAAKVRKQTKMTTGCQTLADVISRHVDAVPRTSEICTQTLPSSTECSGEPAKCPVVSAQGIVDDRLGETSGVGLVDSRVTVQMNLSHVHNTTVHHIVHEKCNFGPNHVWFLFDDLITCYNEENDELRYSYYINIYGEPQHTLSSILNECDSYEISPTDTRYIQCKGTAESEICEILHGVQEYHPG